MAGTVLLGFHCILCHGAWKQQSNSVKLEEFGSQVILSYLPQPLLFCPLFQTFLLVGGGAHFWYWGGAVVASSLGLVLHISSTDFIFSSGGKLNVPLLHRTPIQQQQQHFELMGGNEISPFDVLGDESIKFRCNFFVMCAVLLLGLGIFLPIAVAFSSRNAPPHVLSMALVFIWASLLTAMERFLERSEELGYSM